MIKLELSEQMLVVISNCLANGPYSQVAPVVAEMNRQITEQRNPPEIKEAA